MDNTIYFIEVCFRKGFGIDIQFDNGFVGNAFIISLPFIAIVFRVPRKSKNERTAYPWKWFGFY